MKRPISCVAMLVALLAPTVAGARDSAYGVAIRGASVNGDHSVTIAWVAGERKRLQSIARRRRVRRQERIRPSDDLHDAAAFGRIAHHHDRGARAIRDVHTLRLILRGVRRALGVRPKLAQLDDRQRPVRDGLCRPARGRASTRSGEGTNHKDRVLDRCRPAHSLQATGGHHSEPTTSGDRTTASERHRHTPCREYRPLTTSGGRRFGAEPSSRGSRYAGNGYDAGPRGRSSVGRASASQAEGRGFEPHRPLHEKAPVIGAFR